MPGIACETLIERFPLGFAIDGAGAFVALGRTLQRRCGLAVGDTASARLTAMGPRPGSGDGGLAAVLRDAAQNLRQVRLRLACPERMIDLVGTALEAEALLFLGTLAPEHAVELVATGLTIGDFGPTEVLPSFAMMATVNAISLADARALNTRLETALDAQNALRQKLEEQNARLEDDVAARTQVIAEQARDLQVALEAQQELNVLQRTFVSMASHEFRTPLAIIDGSAHAALRRVNRGELDPEFIALKLSDIRRSVVRMIMLMDSTLAAARAEDAGFHPNIQPLDPRSVVEEICRNHAQATPTHRVNLDIAAAPGEMLVDQSALAQIVSNLVSNAVKYSPTADSVDVRVWQDGADVMIAVQDHGVGIPEDEIARLCDRFFRASTSTGIPGTGIGLNLVKILLESHCGRIEVTSRVGEGTRFVVALPLAGPAEAAAA